MNGHTETPSLIHFDLDALATALAPMIAEQVAEALEHRLKALAPTPGGKLLFSETEAADALGLAPPTLKKYRQQGIVSATRNKKPIGYSAGDLSKAVTALANRGRSTE